MSQIISWQAMMTRWLVPVLLLLLQTFAGAAAGEEVFTMERLIISSQAFAAGGAIPARYTCDGGDISPELIIGQIPEGSRTLAVIMDDPDAPRGTWVHWLVWNIPAATRVIAENSLPPGAIQGRNSWQRNGYGGPCPPSGTHHYVFKVYALDAALALPPASTKADLEQAMQGHILAQGELIGTYAAA